MFVQDPSVSEPEGTALAVVQEVHTAGGRQLQASSTATHLVRDDETHLLKVSDLVAD